MKKKDLGTHIINISNISYKFSKETLIKADKALDHIKKNQRLYKFIVGFIAFCFMPVFIEVGRDYFFELIHALAEAPVEIMTEYILLLTIYFAKAVCFVGIIVNLARVAFIHLAENIKKHTK